MVAPAQLSIFSIGQGPTAGPGGYAVRPTSGPSGYAGRPTAGPSGYAGRQPEQKLKL